MAYTSAALLIERFGESLIIQLTDRAEAPTGAVVASVITQALTDTDAVIDGYVAGKYALPMVETPPLIADIALLIAIYKLHIYQPDPKIELDYKMALKSLEGIRDGNIRLPVAGVAAAGTGGTGARVTDRKRPFEASKMTGFI